MTADTANELLIQCLKRIFFFLIIQAFSNNNLFAQRAPDATGVYRKTAHSIFSIAASDKATAIQMLDATVELVKKVYPEPAGADTGPYGGIFKNYRGVSEFSNGPYVFHVTIPFFELYKTKSGGVQASGEYESSIEIWFNSVKYILQANPVKYGNDKVFRTPLPGIAVNGFPKYNNMILIIPPGKSLPWRPATKQEYLHKTLPCLSFQGAEQCHCNCLRYTFVVRNL